MPDAIKDLEGIYGYIADKSGFLKGPGNTLKSFTKSAANWELCPFGGSNGMIS